MHSRKKAPQFVVDVACYRDNRWAASLCTWHRAVVLSCSHLAGRWAVLEHRLAIFIHK